MGSSAGREERTAEGRQVLVREAALFLHHCHPAVTFLLVSPRHRTKGARTITFAEFQQAMKELCSKRFKGKSPEEALQAVYSLIEGKEPGSMGTTVSMSFLTHCAP